MILVYNKQGLNDTLLCLFQKADNNIATVSEVLADNTIIRQQEKIIGVNIAHASEKFSSLPEGVLLENTINEEVATYLSTEIGIHAFESDTLKQNFVIGYVQERINHPDSNKLSICTVDINTESLQIVCGAANVDQGQKVVVATVGCMMPTGLIIEPSVLRKVDSIGMICSGRELNLPEAFQTPGILVLANDAPIGMSFFEYFNDEMKVK